MLIDYRKRAVRYILKDLICDGYNEIRPKGADARRARMLQIRYFKNKRKPRNLEPPEIKDSGPDATQTCLSVNDDSTHDTPKLLMRTRSSLAGNPPLPSPLREKKKMEFKHKCYRCSTIFGEPDERCGSCNHSHCPRCLGQPTDYARQTDAQDLSSVQPPGLTSCHTLALGSVIHDLGHTNTSSTSTKGRSHLALPVVTEEHAPSSLQPSSLNESYLSTNYDPFMGADQENVSWDKGILDDSELVHDMTLSSGPTLDLGQTSSMPPVDHVSPDQTKSPLISGADYTPNPRRADLLHSGTYDEIAPLESQSKEPFLTKPLPSMISHSKSARSSRSQSLRSDISSLVNRLSKYSLGEREGIKDVLRRFSSSSTLSSRSASVRVNDEAQSRTKPPLLWRPFSSSSSDGIDLPGDFIMSNINTFGARHFACGFGGARPRAFEPYFCQGCFQRRLPQSKQYQFSITRAVIDAKRGNTVDSTRFTFSNPHWSDVFGNTALHVAAALGASCKTLLSMIRSGANVRQTNTAGQTFLHVLSQRSHFGTDDSPTLAQMLKAKDFDFRQIDVKGQTILSSLSQCQLQPLDFASNWLIRLLQFNNDVSEGIHNYGFARSLFESAGGTDEQWTHLGWHEPSHLCKQYSPIIWGWHETSHQYIKYNKQDWPMSWGDEMGYNVMVLKAFKSESYHDLRCFTDTKGRNWLHIAVNPDAKLDSRYDVVEKLLIHGVDANHFDTFGETPLMAHIQGSEDPTVVKLLIDNGANIDSRNRLGEAALHLSIKLGKLPITKALLSYGIHRQGRLPGRWVNVHARNRRGEGVLAVGEIAQRQTWANQGLYAKIAACKALAIDGGAIADPDLFQEWGLEEGEHSGLWPIPSGRSPFEQHALYY